MAPDGGVHSVDPRMISAHDVVFQPEDVLAPGERDVHLESTFQGGDPYEEHLLGLQRARVLVLVHLIPYLLALPVVLLRGKHACETDWIFLVQLPVVRRNLAAERVGQNKAANFLRDDGPIQCQRREARHGVGTVVLPSRSGARLEPEL